MRLRPPTAADAEGVLELIVARDVADLGVPDYTLADLRQEWELDEVDLARDAVVVEDEDGSLLAYALVRSVGAQVIVPPQHTGRGIGTTLLRWADERGPRRQWLSERDTAGRELLERNGYRLARHYWRMERDLGAPVEPPAPPEGFELRALDPRADAEAVHALDAAAFAGTPDDRPMSLAAFIEEHLEAHDLDPGLSLVAERDGRLVGLLITRRWDEDGVGFVADLAVDAHEQGRGLGTALLLNAFAGYRAAGLRAAQLGVASDNPRALRLYERAGMTQRFRFDVFEHSASDTPAATAGTTA
jgi:mycothiol synthase